MNTTNNKSSHSSTLFNAGEKDYDKQRTTAFSLTEDPHAYVNYKLPSYESNLQPETSLKDFLKRPTLIQTISWAPGATLNWLFSPWGDFFSNTYIKNKLENFYLVKGTLKIKIVVTANPGYYGAAYASYQPLSDANPCPIIETATYDGWMVPFSQRPGIDINVEDNTGGEMILPFIFMKEWLDVTSLSEMDNMGAMNIRNFTPLTSVGSGTTPVTIRVFAYMEEIELSASTRSAALQSGEYEEKDGIISKPASAVANIAGMLKKAPVIGPFAKATEMVANTIGDVAKIFGFTNPPVLQDAVPYKNSSIPPLSTTDICQPYERLALDSKNELSIDNTIRGMTSKDELNIQNFCMRNSFIDYNSWSSSDAPGTAIWLSYVTPELARRDGVSNFKAQPTFACAAAQNYQYWRGEVVFGVRVVCSKNHAGSLRICYDPHGDLTSTSPSFTSVVNQIIDITTDKVTEFVVPWTASQAFLPTQRSPFTQNFGLGAISGPSPEYANGTIRVEVCTQQTCYNATADIQVLFYSYVKNIEFASPVGVSGDISWYPLQSGLATTNDDNELLVTKSDEDKMGLIYFGETNRSFRPLFQRMNYSRTIPGVPNTTNLYELQYSFFNRYPLYYGYDVNGIDEAAGTLTPASDFSFNFVKNTPFHIITSCFVASYGSINWMIIQDGIDNQLASTLDRAPSPTTAPGYNAATGLATTATTDQKVRWTINWLGDSSTGRNLAKNNLAPNQVNIPLYSNKKFRFNTAASRTLGRSDDNSYIDNVMYRSVYKPTLTNGNGQSTMHHFYFGAGPDFNCVMQLNVPTWQQCVLPSGKDT